nr:pentatricopeptide repeat-containing protein [Quercus suber]
MDEEGWYSVTPEQIAIRHALRCVTATAKPNPVVIDCFAGVGGNAIQFARTCCSVVAIDIDPKKLEFAINNAKIYGVQHCIDFIVGDFFQLAPSLKADTTAYNVVISLFCEKGGMAMAEELMNEMGLSDIYPDMILYVTMMKGFYNVGRLEDACGLVKFMRGLGCVRNLVVYSTLLYERGSMERALELLGEMEKEVGNCSPHVVTYTSVMQSFCEKGQTMEALENLDRTEAFEYAPNRVTVSALINGFCMEGHVEKAYKVIDKVVAGANASYEEAEKFIRNMLATGVKPDSLACSILIRELCLEGRVLDGFYLSEEVEKLEFFTSIDSDLYSILLVGLCQQSHLVEAAKLARLMLKKGISLKASYVDSIAEHLKKFENEELVKQLSMIEK